MSSPAPDPGAPPEDEPDTRPGGLLHSLRTLVATLLATMRARGELLQVELEEERLRIAGILLFAVAAVFFLALGVLLLSVFVLLLFWDSNRLLAAGLLTLAYLLIGVACASVAHNRSRTKSKLFASSLAVLDEDVRQLKQEP